MVEKIINSVIAKLDGKIPTDEISKVRDILAVTLSDYEFTSKSHELSCIIIPECLNIYLATKKIEGKSDNSINLYRLYLNEFVRIIQKPLENVTANDIRMYLYLIQENRKISNRTLDSRRTVVCSFLGWCAAEGYISKNPAINITPIKYERKERVPLTDIQLEKVRNACSTSRETAMVEVLYSSGCRVTELARLNISDVNFDTREIKLFGKGDKHRTSYLSAKAIVALQVYLASRTDDCEALFVSTKKPIKRMQKNGLEAIIRKLGKKCEMPFLHPHLFRHTVATDCLKRGMDVTALQKMLGHRSLETTMIYAKVSDDTVRASCDKYIV